MNMTETFVAGKFNDDGIIILVSPDGKAPYEVKSEPAARALSATFRDKVHIYKVREDGKATLFQAAKDDADAPKELTLSSEQIRSLSFK